MKKRVGVFLCRCGDNIAGMVDFDRLRPKLQTLPEVAFVAEHNLLCSPDGKSFIADRLKEAEGTHAVVAACSPKDHENDFREGVTNAGINPYLLQVANIREQCAWVTRDQERAFAKAVALIKAAYRRVRAHEALVAAEIDCDPNVLVIGGGIAGVEAALVAAQQGRQVTLVDRAPSIGGRVPQYEEVAPNMECAPCLIAPRLSMVADNDAINVLTYTEVEDILGFVGNFKARLKVLARRVDPELCVGCDECMQVCPVEVDHSFDHGLGKRKAIYIEFPGSHPNCAVIDQQACLRSSGESCTSCADACPMEAIDFQQTDQTLELNSGAVILATGSEEYDPSSIERFGYRRLPDVYRLGELERLCSSTGPTGAKLVKRDGEPPQRIVVIHCVGRSELGYCSGNCCGPALKVAPLARHQQLDCTVTHLHTDLVLPAWAGASLRAKAEQQGAQFIRVGEPQRTRVDQDADGMAVRFVDAAGNDQQISADLVVLVSGSQPNAATARFAEMLDLVRDDAGFVAPDHPLLRSAQSSTDGVYLAGCVAGPKSVGESIQQAHAAAGLALAKIQPGRKLSIETMTAETNSALCSGCLMCSVVCPYKAIRPNAEGFAEVNEVLCMGCGTCVASCPSGAAKARHFTDEQLNRELQEVLHG